MRDQSFWIGRARQERAIRQLDAITAASFADMEEGARHEILDRLQREARGVFWTQEDVWRQNRERMSQLFRRKKKSSE